MAIPCVCCTHDHMHERILSYSFHVLFSLCIQLLTASLDGRVIVWDFIDGSLLRVSYQATTPP